MKVQIALHVLSRIVVAGAITIFVTAIAFDAAMRGRAPALALMVWPSDGLAAANLASKNFSDQTAGKFNPLEAIPDADTVALSRRALATEPLAAGAITLIALAKRDAHQRFGLLKASRQLDKRNVLTQSHLFAEYSRRGKIDEAVITLGQILNVHPEYRGPYAKALVVILADVDNETAVETLIKGDLKLANAVLLEASGVDATVKSAARIRINNPRRVLGDRQTDRAILGGLLRIGDFNATFGLYDLLKKDKIAQAQEGQLELGINKFPPIDWTFNPNGRTPVEWVPPDHKAIKVLIPATLSGEIARRFFRIKPGTYRLESGASALTGNLLNFELSAQLECVEPNVVTTLPELRIIPSFSPGPTILIKPNVCRYFRIILYGSSARSDKDVELFIHRITLVALPRQGSISNVNLL